LSAGYGALKIAPGKAVAPCQAGGIRQEAWLCLRKLKGFLDSIVLLGLWFYREV
jgi:hypothetical protein